MPQGRGLFSSLGGYVRGAGGYLGGAGRGLAGMAGPMRSGAGMSGLALGAGLRSAATGGMGGTAAGALWGGLAGGAYGAMSNDTTILGGMVGGAALGAGAMRYGGAGLKGMNRLASANARIGAPRAPMGTFARRGLGAAMGQMRGDFRGALLAANQGMGKIRGMY